MIKRNQYTGLRDRTPEQMAIDALIPRMEPTPEQRNYLKHCSFRELVQWRPTPEQSRAWLEEWGRRIREMTH